MEFVAIFIQEKNAARSREMFVKVREIRSFVFES